MAKARDIEPHVIDIVRGDWELAKRGHKSAKVQQWADTLGISYQTLYAALPTNRVRIGEPKIIGLESAARTVATYKFQAPDYRRQKVTEDAVLQAVRNGDLEERFLQVHASTFDKMIRRLGLAPKKDRKEHFQAERPNQLHHIDGSTSDVFYIAKRLPDGDYLLKMHKGHKDYKNKPVPVDGLRPWYYGYVDDYSGCWTARMCAACGESAIDNIAFLCWAWSEDSGMPWHGVPERLMGDKGPMMRDKNIKEFLGRTGIDVEKVMPGNKDAHGKIEKIWDVVWSRFEANFFIGDWQHFEITMTELNRRFQIFQKEWSSKRKHRFEKKFSRLQMWERINLHGGAVMFPENAIKTVVRGYTRTLDQCGCCTIDGVTYEVKGLHLAKVKLYMGMFDQKLVAVDIRDGRKYEVKSFANPSDVANKLDEFKGNFKTEHRKVREEGALLKHATNMLHLAETQASEAGPRKVLKIKTRKSVRPIENHLNVETYPGVMEAIAAFQELTGIILEREERKAVGELIEANGLSRRFVAGLAAEVQTEQTATAM